MLTTHLSEAARAVRALNEEVGTRRRWWPRSREERLRFWYARRCAQYCLTRLRAKWPGPEGATVREMIAWHVGDSESDAIAGIDELVDFIESHVLG